MVDLEFPLPSYMQALEKNVPAYSTDVQAGEQTLISIPRAGHRLRASPPTKFERTFGSFSVILEGQSSSCAAPPTYGLNGNISGAIKFQKGQPIAEIVIKMCGKMDIVISGCGAASETLISETCTLLIDKDAGSSQLNGSAFISIPFLLPIPHQYIDTDGVLRPIPPSIDTTLHEPPALVAKVSYHLEVHVLSKPKLGGLWLPEKKLDIPFNYHPRMRPDRPIIGNPYLLETFKAAPEEWYESCSQLEYKDTSKCPIHADFFIPAAKIFALSEPIPMHIHLSGFESHLAEFLPPSYTTPSLSSPLPKNESSRVAPEFREPVVKVQLLRQIVAVIRGFKSFKNVPIGDGELIPLSLCRSSNGDGEIHLDWAGVLRPDPKVVLNAGFTTGNLSMNDFLVLSIVPSCKSVFREMTLPVSIRIVTDPWIDTASGDDHEDWMRSRTQLLP